MELSSLRPKLVLALKQGIIGGSFVMYIPDDGSPEVFHLNEIGVKRDKQGNVLKLILKQSVMYQSLAPKIQAQLDKDKDLSDDCKNGKKALDMHTCIVKDKGMFKVWQEIKDNRIQGTDGTYKPQDLPYIFVPFVDNGEDYGRSYVEDFIGDLQSYEGLRQSLLEAAAESARIIYLLNPNSVLSLKKLKEAQSGDVLLGSLDDVGVLQANKSLDMAVTQAEADSLRQEISITFLLDSAVRRNAERVTAEEIRQVSQELEVGLGGIYSTISNTLQRPLVRLYMNRLVKKKKLNEVLKNSTELEITTGSAALGRGSDFQTLTTFVTTLTQIMLATGAGSYIDMPELIKRLAYSLDINTATLVKTQEQIAAEQQAASEAQAQQEAAPDIMKQNNEAQLQQE
jgi:hypothetical protein